MSEVTGRHAQQLQERSVELAMLTAKADEHEQNRLSDATKRLYQQDWNQFESWCARHALCPLPADPESVRLYLTDLSIRLRPDGSFAYKPSTMERRLAGIGAVHAAQGFSRLTRHPRVSGVMAGIRKERSVRPRRMRPLLLDDVKTILAAMDYSTWPAGVAAARDAFVLLAGFAGAFRRAEVATLTVGQVTRHTHDGLHVFLAISKTDQEGAGVTLGLPYGHHAQTCAPCAWTRWTRMLAAAPLGRAAVMQEVLATGGWDHWRHVCRGEDGPDLRPEAPLLRAIWRGGVIGDSSVSGEALHAVVKRRAAAAGFNNRDIGFHSLRAGFVTQARRNGADARSIRLQTRHGSDAMVDVYDREYVPLAGGNAVFNLGL